MRRRVAGRVSEPGDLLPEDLTPLQRKAIRQAGEAAQSYHDLQRYELLGLEEAAEEEARRFDKLAVRARATMDQVKAEARELGIPWLDEPEIEEAGDHD